MSIGDIFHGVYIGTTLIIFVVVFIFSIEMNIVQNITGLSYQVVGFILILITTKNKIKISKIDLENDGFVEIKFISKRKFWQLGIVLVITGIVFQIFAVIFPIIFKIE